jgi:phage terminase large subunit
MKMIVSTLTQEMIAQKTKQYLCLYGGRGGGKSWAVADYLIARCMAQAETALCTREAQNSIDDSVYALPVKWLNYHGVARYFTIKRVEIITPFGGKIIFHGLRERDTVHSLKSMEGVTICWVEEAQYITKESLAILIPTIRAPGSNIIYTFNRTREYDPVYVRHCLNREDDTWVKKINYYDNPYCPQAIKDDAAKASPDDYAHIYEGEPRRTTDNTVFSSARIMAAMKRTGVDDDGVAQCGIDVARFGSDKSVIYVRRGLRSLEMIEATGKPTGEIARLAVGSAAKYTDNPLLKVYYKIDDTGVGGGVTDALRDMGCAHVYGVNNNDNALDRDHYADAITEMFFSLPVDAMSIVHDEELMDELAGRRYDYDKRGRKQIEPKAKIKERLRRSPDKSDALLLAFYEPRNKIVPGLNKLF